MKMSRVLLSCLMVLASATLSQAEITQHFDRTGKLVPAVRRSVTPQLHRMRKYSVPEGIELRPDVHYEFYPVFGKTFAQIVKSAEENGPRNKITKKRQVSSFDWSLGWTYDYSFSLEQDDDQEKVHCDLMIVDPVLSYDFIVMLPALTDDSALNPMEKDLWKNYVASLLEQAYSRIRIIKDDTKDAILKQFGEIAYILLNRDEENNAEKIVERFVRTETEKVGSAMIRQIQQNLDAYDSSPARNIGSTPATQP